MESEIWLGFWRCSNNPTSHPLPLLTPYPLRLSPDKVVGLASGRDAEASGLDAEATPRQ